MNMTNAPSRHDKMKSNFPSNSLLYNSQSHLCCRTPPHSRPQRLSRFQRFARQTAGADAAAAAEDAADAAADAAAAAAAVFAAAVTCLGRNRGEAVGHFTAAASPR